MLLVSEPSYNITSYLYLREDTIMFTEYTHTHTHTHTHKHTHTQTAGLTNLRDDNTVYRTLTGDNRSVDSALTDCCKRLKTMTYAMYVRVMRQVYFQSTP